MSSLTGNLISDSYQGLLKTADKGPISSTLKNITDGNGNDTALTLSSNQVVVTGSITSVGVGNDNQTYLIPEGIVIESLVNSAYIYADKYGIELGSGSNYMDITVDGNNFSDGYPGTLIVVGDNSDNPVPVITFQNHDNWTDGRVSITTPLIAESGSIVTGSLTVTETIAGRGLDITGSIAVQATGSINLNGVLSFTEGAFVLPTTPAPIPVVGSAYFEPISGSLYIYNGSTYLSVALS